MAKEKFSDRRIIREEILEHQEGEKKSKREKTRNMGNYHRASFSSKLYITNETKIVTTSALIPSAVIREKHREIIYNTHTHTPHKAVEGDTGSNVTTSQETPRRASSHQE